VKPFFRLNLHREVCLPGGCDVVVSDQKHCEATFAQNGLTVENGGRRREVESVLYHYPKREKGCAHPRAEGNPPATKLRNVEATGGVRHSRARERTEKGGGKCRLNRGRRKSPHMRTNRVFPRNCLRGVRGNDSQGARGVYGRHCGPA